MVTGTERPRSIGRFVYLLLRALIVGTVAADVALVALMGGGAALTTHPNAPYPTDALIETAFLGPIMIGYHALLVSVPIAAVLSWWPYRLGVRMPLLYIAIGALAAFGIPATRLAADPNIFHFYPFYLLLLSAAFGAIAGWNFARGLVPGQIVSGNGSAISLQRPFGHQTHAQEKSRLRSVSGPQRPRDNAQAAPRP